MYGIWCVLCLLVGYFTGDVGRTIVATAGMAASEAVSLGIAIGLIVGAALEAFYFLKVRDND